MSENHIKVLDSSEINYLQIIEDDEGLGKPADFKVIVSNPEHHPYCCPVCGGRRFVPPGFYNIGLSTSIVNENCRSCNGTGIVWG